MKQVYFILIALALSMFSSQAQEIKKPVLGIEDFTYSSDFNPADVELIRNKIVKEIQNTGRVIVLDHNASTSKALNTESERRKKESAMDANEVADMTSLNATSLLTVHLDQIGTSRETYEDYEYVKGSDGKSQKKIKGRYPYYKGNLSYTVKITDCATGAVQGQETFNFSDGYYSTFANKADYESSEAARRGILNKCMDSDGFKLLILNTFRPSGKIIQIDEGNGKKAKTVFVNLGSADGIQNKQVLEVYKEFELDGEISKKLIGEIEVTEILGNSRCLAKVKKGGEDIQQIMDKGGNLPVQTRAVKKKFFGGVK